VNGDEWWFRIGFRKLPVFREAVKPRLVGGDRSHGATFFTVDSLVSLVLIDFQTNFSVNSTTGPFSGIVEELKFTERLRNEAEKFLRILDHPIGAGFN